MKKTKTRKKKPAVAELDEYEQEALELGVPVLRSLQDQRAKELDANVYVALMREDGGEQQRVKKEKQAKREKK